MEIAKTIAGILHTLEWIEGDGIVLLITLLAVVVLVMTASACKGGRSKMSDEKVIYIQNRNGEWRVWASLIGCSREFPDQLDTPTWETEREASAFAEGWRLDRADIECIDFLPPHIDPPIPITPGEVWELWSRVLAAEGVRSLEFVKDPFCIRVQPWGNAFSTSFTSFQACKEWMDRKGGAKWVDEAF